MTGKYFIYFKIMIIKRIRSENLNFENFLSFALKYDRNSTLWCVCVSLEGAYISAVRSGVST